MRKKYFGPAALLCACTLCTLSFPALAADEPAKPAAEGQPAAGAPAGTQSPGGPAGAPASLAQLPPAVRNQVVSAVVPDTIADLMKSIGLGCEQIKRTDGDPVFKITLGGMGALLYLAGPTKDGKSFTSLDLYSFVRTKDKVGLLTLNEWNSSHRYCRAWYDEKQNLPVLESDLDLGGGVTKGSIQQYIYTYFIGLHQYATFLAPKPAA